MAIELGNAAEWAAAVGTVGALGFTYRLLRLEASSIALSRREREAAQAERVHAWRTGRIRLSESADEIVVRLHNGSDQPVYAFGAGVWAAWPPVGDSEGQYLTVLGPGESHDLRLAIHRLGLAADSDPPVETAFTDAAGRHWARDPHGALARRDASASNDFLKRSERVRPSGELDIDRLFAEADDSAPPVED